MKTISPFLIALFALAMPGAVHAQDAGAGAVVCEGSRATTEPMSIDAINEWARVARALPFRVLADTSTAPCMPRELTVAEMGQWIAENPGHGPRESRTIYGIEFVDQPTVLLDLFHQLTTPEFLRTGTTYTVPEGCHEFQCAAAAVLGGEEFATRAAYLLARYHLNTSPVSGASILIAEAVSPFTNEQLRDVLSGATALPSHLISLFHNQSVQHYLRGGPRQPKGTIADARIMMFDAWDLLDAQDRRGTVVHELGHRVSMALGDLDGSEDWLRISDWMNHRRVDDGETEASDHWRPHRPSTCVSGYGTTSRAEDFAESFVAYRFQPEMLRRASPEKYAFMRDRVFQGIEYTSADSCRERR